MVNRFNEIRFLVFIIILIVPGQLTADTIDRKSVVERHNIRMTDVSQILSLGNGEFSVGVDGTGLQTIGGNIMSHWAWHSFPLPQGSTMADVPETGTIETGRLKNEMRHASAKPEVSAWMFENPHLFNLGRFRFVDSAGKVIDTSQIKDPQRMLDLWKGIHITEYFMDGHRVKVKTVVHPDIDMIAVRIESDLIGTGQLALELDFPYPVGSSKNKLQNSWYGNWGACDKHKTQVEKYKNRADFYRIIDQVKYFVSWEWSDQEAALKEINENHTFRLIGSQGSNSIDFVCAFGIKKTVSLPGFNKSIVASSAEWKSYWQSGGAIDLSESKDPRWKELERRIVLSQYLMGTQSAGSWPPAEVALMGVDYWSSQFHMEMVWWHLAHYGLWNRWEKASPALQCYEKFLPTARKLAAQFDYKGAKWGKMVGPEGRTAPWEPTYLLHWQQPHPIFFAELEYRITPTNSTLKKWQTIVFETADYMADFPVRGQDRKYHLTPVRTANENGNGSDPAFEIAYWRWGLEKAQEWRVRLGMKRNVNWDNIISNLAPLPQHEGVYLFCDEWLDSYTRLNYGHPDPLGTCAFIPFTQGIDPLVAKRTVEKIFSEWRWENTWGWDFPWSAMAAARVGRSDLAIEILLKETTKNSYSINGINEGWYFPGNGGLLYAVAMMAAGWDGAPKTNAPGFPDNGQWVVKWEKLNKAL